MTEEKMLPADTDKNATAEADLGKPGNDIPKDTNVELEEDDA